MTKELDSFLVQTPSIGSDIKGNRVTMLDNQTVRSIILIECDRMSSWTRYSGYLIIKTPVAYQLKNSFSCTCHYLRQNSMTPIFDLEMRSNSITSLAWDFKNFSKTVTAFMEEYKTVYLFYYIDNFETIQEISTFLRFQITRVSGPSSQAVKEYLWILRRI